MKFVSAAIVISAIAAKAIAETDVVEPVEVGEDLLNEDPSKVADVEVKKNTGSAFMSISTTCNNVQFWVKNRKVDDSAKSGSRRSRRSRELYDYTFEDAGIEGYAGNNCAPTTAGGDFNALACHPDANVATHFTLLEVEMDSVVDVNWEYNTGDGRRRLGDDDDDEEEEDCDFSVRFTCPPMCETCMPYFVVRTPTSGFTSLGDPCELYYWRRNLRKNA